MKLFADHVLVTRTEGFQESYDEVLAPLVLLSFDYGGTRVDASDLRPHVFHHDGRALAVMERNFTAEVDAKRVLERMGAVDLSCIDVAPPPRCEADYVVRVEEGPHAFCAFTAEALRRLPDLGWEIEIDPKYPFRTVEPSSEWFAEVRRAAASAATAVNASDRGAQTQPPQSSDWFTLELGVDVDGVRIDLLPLVIGLIEETKGGDDLSALERRFRSSYALRVSDTKHVTLSPKRLQALLRVVIELYQNGVRNDGKVGFPGVRAPALVCVDEALRREGARISWKDDTKLVERARVLTTRPEPVKTPANLQATLRPYQEEGVAYLQHLTTCGVGGILADDMGLGKTLQTIAHLAIEKESGRMTAPALVVAPTSLVGNWARELERFAPHLSVVILHGPTRHSRYAAIAKSDVVITTYPILVRDEERFAGERFHVVILDEAQTIKNSRGQSHRAVKGIDAEHRLCLTGTPIENHLGELWALFDFLNPGLLGDELCFRRHYRHPIEDLGDHERLMALREQIAPYILRRVKRDVAKELPPKTELNRPIELTGRQRELYEQIRVAAHSEVRKAIRTRGLAASSIAILDALMKLRQVCCDPRLVRMDAARGVHESAKYTALFELLDQQLAQGHRILVFSQFTSMLALISEGLRTRNVAHAILTGSTRDRQGTVDAFESGQADVFLISLKAGGTGLNLTSADTVIHYDPWWNPAAQAQATDRAYRIGQARPVFVHNLYCAGSVEERVLALQKRKRGLSNNLLGDAVEEGATWTPGEVDALFAPLEDNSARA